MDAVVLVQKEALNQLLLGTDVQAELGIAVMVKKCDQLRQEECDLKRKQSSPRVRLSGAATNGEKDSAVDSPCAKTREGHQDRDALMKDPDSEGRPDPDEPAETSPQVGVVQLLQTVKVPAGYKKIVRGRVQGGVESTLMLFTSTIDRTDVLLADSAVDSSDGVCAHGCTREPLTLSRLPQSLLAAHTTLG